MAGRDRREEGTTKVTKSTKDFSVSFVSFVVEVLNGPRKTPGYIAAIPAAMRAMFSPWLLASCVIAGVMPPR